MADEPPRWWPSEGDEPDPRWSLANERTLLAYQRTALGLVVAGFAVAGSHAVTDTPAVLAALGLPLIALGAGAAVTGRTRYLATQRALRTGQSITAPRGAVLLPWGISTVAIVGLIAAAVGLVF